MSTLKLSIPTIKSSETSRLTQSPDRIQSPDGGFIYGEGILRQDLSDRQVDELKRALTDALGSLDGEPPKPVRTIIFRTTMESGNITQSTFSKDISMNGVAMNGMKQSSVPKLGGGIRRHSRTKDDDKAAWRTIPVDLQRRATGGYEDGETADSIRPLNNRSATLGGFTSIIVKNS